MYRWASGNRTRIRTEPIPSELLKATGMQPSHEKSRTRQDVSYALNGIRARGLLFVLDLFIMPA